MKFIKKHESTFVGLGVFVLVIIGLLLVKNIFSPTEAKAIYGNRLEERNKYIISAKEKNQAKENIGDKASTVNVRIAGRIIYIDVKVNGETSVEDAKNLGEEAIKAFSDKEKKYYEEKTRQMNNMYNEAHIVNENQNKNEIDETTPIIVK